MAREVGRKLLVQRNIGSPPTLTTIAGVRTKTVTINKEPIDVSNDDDFGWRTLLADPGQKSVDLSVAGIPVDEELLAAILAGGTVGFEDVTITFPGGGGTLQGDFFFTNLTYSGEYNAGITFEGEMQSSGAVTYTP